MSNSPAIKYGLYFGMATSAIFMVLYLVNPRLMMNIPITIVIGYLFPIFFMVLAGREKRSSLEGFISFGEAVKETFLCYLIGSFIITVFTYILYNIIDPSLIDVMMDEAAKMGESFMRMMGAEEAEIQEGTKEMAKIDFNPMSPGLLFFNWMVGLVFPGIIISLIISAIIKNSSD
jgi:hypothetical protein